MSETTKVRSICVDTLTAIQTEDYMSRHDKPDYDAWTDYGKDIWVFIKRLQSMGFECILILGEPGTGKSTGMRTLDHNSNIWYNADNKNPVWKGGREEYGTKSKPRSPYHKIPKTYDDIARHIKTGLDKGMFAENRYAFLMGHVEDYKSGPDYKQRLKLLGKVATKFSLEGKLETVMYASVTVDGSDRQYLLEPHNNGFNTARSPMGLFEETIPNDYKMLLDKLEAY